MNWVLFLVTRWLIWGASWSIFLSRFHCHTLGLCPAPHDQTEGQLFPCILQKFEKGNWFLDWNESYAHHDLIGLLWLVSLVRRLQCPTHEKMLLPRPEAPLSPSGGSLPGLPHPSPQWTPFTGSKLYLWPADDHISLGLARLEDAQASQSWGWGAVLGKKTRKPCTPSPQVSEASTAHLAGPYRKLCWEPCGSSPTPGNLAPSLDTWVP